MPRRFALIGTVVLAAVAHAEEVEWKPAKPLPGPALKAESAAARIGRPEQLPFPRMLPDAVADGPRLAPPPVQSPPSVVILPRAPFPLISIQGGVSVPGPEFEPRPAPYNSAAAEQPHPDRPSPTPTARLMPPMPPAAEAMPVSTPQPMPPKAPEATTARPRSQAPYFLLPPKPGGKRPQ